MPVDFEISPLITPTPAPFTPAQPPVPPEASQPTPPIMANRSTKLLKWLVLVAAGLVVITIGMLWWGNGSFSDKNVEVTLKTADRAASGEELTYAVEYKNNTKVDLTQMQFRLFYPEGSIVMKDGTPTTPESEGFTIDTLKPGESGTKEFKAFITGDKGESKTAKLTVVFNAGTLRSSFQKEVTATTTISTLPVTLTLVAPPTTVSGQPIQYLLDLRNDSGSALSDLRVVFTYPDGFTVQKTSPQPASGNTTWAIDTLGTSGGKRITIDGILAGNEKETKTVSVSLQRNLNGQYIDYVRTEAFTMLSSPLLSVSVAPDGGRDYVAFPGDTLHYTVSYANNSRFTLLGMTLSVKLEGDMYDTSRLQLSQGFYDDGSRTITFDSSGVSDLSAMPPGRTGRLTFSIPLKAGISDGSLGGAKNFYVKATARFSTTNVPSGIDGSEVFTSDSVTTKIGSQPSLTQAVLYDNNAGSGPIPPVVGSETTYTIRWQLTNPGNDVKDSKVVATLPPGVTFKGGATTANGTAPAYDRVRSTVTWVVGTLPFGTGNGMPRYEATFQVSIKPASNQQGQSVKLITNASLSGTDSFTSQAVGSSPRDITTNDVVGHSGDGSVQ